VIVAPASVGAVISFDEPMPARLSADPQPEVLAKGGDWPAETPVGPAG
jgi:bifunctional ADP-heptose synthase (sugar kinase/adenylyltransferase)